MERVFFIKNGDLKAVNELLQKGGKIKIIQPVSEGIAAYGYAGGEIGLANEGSYVSDIYAYIVVEFN